MSKPSTPSRAVLVVAVLVVAVMALAGCATSPDYQAVVADAPLPATTITTEAATTTTAAPQPTTTAPPTTEAPAVANAAAESVSVPEPGSARVVTEQAWTAFATAGGITLRHPSSRVEHIGFHESTHDGARQLKLLPTAVNPTTLESRGRPTDSRTAADVVVDPSLGIRSPVSGTVQVAGTYVLYCNYSDDYVIIEPDEHPGWQVKVLHINGVQVGAGDRVTAGQTFLAPGPTQLPFGSQVDDVRTAEPPWPHTHIEIIDPSIPDIPSPDDEC